jgi:biopolymer transport protein ExbD
VRRHKSFDNELNLAALIDIFSIMLFFLMTTVTFLSLKTLNASVPALTKAADTSTKNAVNVSVRMTAEGYSLQASGQPADTSQKELNISLSIPRKTSLFGKGPQYDTKSLTEELWKIKKVSPETKTVMIFPEPDVKFENVIRTMDATREMPSIVNPNKRVPLFTRPVLSELIK